MHACIHAQRPDGPGTYVRSDGALGPAWRVVSLSESARHACMQVLSCDAGRRHLGAAAAAG